MADAGPFAGTLSEIFARAVKEYREEQSTLGSLEAPDQPDEI